MLAKKEVYEKNGPLCSASQRREKRHNNQAFNCYASATTSVLLSRIALLSVEFCIACGLLRILVCVFGLFHPALQ